MIRFLTIVLFSWLLGAAPDGEQRIRDAVRDELDASFPAFASRVQVNVSRLNWNPSNSPIRIELPGDGLPRAHTRIAVLEESDGRWSRAGWAMLYVSHYDSVLIPLRDLARGDEVTPEDVTASWMETTRFHGEPATVVLLPSLRGGPFVAQRSLRAGKPLRTSDISPPHAVQTGEAVTLRYERPGFRLELNGQARESGHVGDAIRVFSSDTNSMYRARITAPREAVWLQTL